MAKITPVISVPESSEIRVSVLEYMRPITERISPFETSEILKTASVISNFLEQANSPLDYAKRDYAVRLCVEQWATPNIFNDKKFIEGISMIYSYIADSTPIQPTDLSSTEEVNIRVNAIKMACEKNPQTVRSEYVLKDAKAFEEYIKSGSTDFSSRQPKED